jgi:WD40 repeat protein
MSALNGENYNGMLGHEGPVRSIAAMPSSGVFYSSGSDGKILRWDLANIKSYRTLIDNNFINRSLAVSPNGRWLACGTPTSGIQLFNLNTGVVNPHSCRDIKVGSNHLVLLQTVRDYILPAPAML